MVKIDMRRLLVVGLILLVGSVVVTIFLWAHPAGDGYSHYPHYPFYASISADGNYIVARYRGPESFVLLFGQENNTPLWNISPPTIIPSYWTEASTISADGDYIVVGTRERLYLFGKNDSEPLWVYHIHVKTDAVAISHDGSYIAAGTDGGIYLFKKEDNAPFWLTSIGEVRSISMSDNGDYTVVGAGALYVYSRVDNIFLSYSYPDKSVSISADGNYVAVGEGYYLYLFNRVENVLLWSYEFPENHNLIGEVSISADGNYVIVDGGGTIYSRTNSLPDGWGGVYLFSKAENVPLWSYWSDGWVGKTNTSISSDGNRIAVAHERKLHLFSRQSNTPLWSWVPPEQTYISSASISPNGNYIAVGTEGGPAPNIGGSVYLFNKDGNIVWSYFHEVEPYLLI